MLASAFHEAFARFKTSKAYMLSDLEGPISIAEIEEFERASRIRFPAAYKDVALTIGVGQIGFVTLFSPRSGPYSIETQRHVSAGLPDIFLPISDNGCGDLYGFSVHSGQCKPAVYHADHDAQYKITPTEFLDLYEYIARCAFKAV
jgi:hypothetical protein